MATATASATLPASGGGWATSPSWRRRPLVRPVGPVADGRRRIRRRRFPCVDPVFGTLDDAAELIAEAHRSACGPSSTWCRTISDRIPGFTGTRLAAGVARTGTVLVPARLGAAARRRRTAGSRSSAARLDPDRRGRRVVPASVRPRAARPQLDAPRVWAEHEDILRFWFDRGVDGVRIHSAALLVKHPELAEFAADGAPASTRSPTGTSYTTSTAAGGDRRQLRGAARSGR